MAAVLQSRPVHRRGFLAGRWVPREHGADSASNAKTPTILVQIRPDRAAEISLRLQELGIGAITDGDVPSRFSILLTGGVPVADALSSVCDIPGVLSAMLASPSLAEGCA